jgi:hypothetical protein
MYNSTDRVVREISEKTFLTLQGAIALIVTVSLGFQGWMLLSIHDIQVQGARVDQQILATASMQERIIAFNQAIRVNVQDLEVRVRVLETFHKASAQRVGNNLLVNTSESGACYLEDTLQAAILRRRKFL